MRIEQLNHLLREATSYQATDLHLTVGITPIIRKDTDMIPLECWQQKLSPNDTRELLNGLFSYENSEFRRKDLQQQFEKRGDINISYSIPGLSRFRINVFRQRNSVAFAIRLFPERVRTLDELGLPATIRKLSHIKSGLVIVTGKTGSGKSTTLAAMIDEINKTRKCHIITLEDPIEYLHKHNQSIVNQREVYTDADNYPNALHAALRENPDVLMISEMRTPETMLTAIQAAETGHLVFATLHTPSAAQTIGRIIMSLPPSYQTQVCTQLSLSLQAVIAQQLLPRQDGAGLVAATEIMISTPAIATQIRDNKPNQIDSIIDSSVQDGMMTMKRSLEDLYRRRLISKEVLEERLSRVGDENYISSHDLLLHREQPSIAGRSVAAYFKENNP